MSVYNGEKWLNEAVDSILNQTFKDFEFIVINDGSNDQTYTILNSYNDKRLRIINHKSNRGLTARLNEGLDKSKGKYIARMDADDISLPERFKIQIDFRYNTNFLKSQKKHHKDLVYNKSLVFYDQEFLVQLLKKLRQYDFAYL